MSGRFRAGGRVLHALPLFTPMALFRATNVALPAGASIILLPRFDAEELMRLMPGATVLMGVPTVLYRLPRIRASPAELTRRTMRLFVSGSRAASLADTPRAFPKPARATAFSSVTRQ